MFHSATLKLTAWYLLILMSISLLFSAAIYKVTSDELSSRLGEFQERFEQPDMAPYTSPNHRLFSAFRDGQRLTADRNIMFTLAYVNLLILLGGGALSYLLARRTLHQLEQAHEAQSRFTSDASHELRTPLAAMKIELELALSDPKISKTEMHEILQSNLEEVDRLATLSTTLLQLSRMDYSSLDFGKVDANTVAEEVVQRYDKNAERIKLTLPKSSTYIRANQASIEELFTILVDNALKYSPAKSRITASISVHGKQARFSISNGGAGIPANKLPRIFDRFYRADESRSKGGAGLGLSLAKEIVELHRGELQVSSTKGETTFRVVLPLFRKS